jgi:hypothetical protein
MKKVSLHKENAYLLGFLVMSIIALFIVQSNKVDVYSQQTSTVLSASAERIDPVKSAQRQEVTTNHVKGELFATDRTPEVGKEVTFHLKQYTPDPEAKYYLQIGSRKILFNGGSLKHTFYDEGLVLAELYCYFEGQDFRLDKEELDVAKKMESQKMASILEN